MEQQPYLLNNKVAIVTGASSGLGAVIAEQFAAAGCHLVLASRGKAALNQVATQIQKTYGVPVLAMETDISDQTAVQTMVAAAIKQFGKIDILVNNAGVVDTGLKSAANYLDTDFERVVSVNQRGTMQVTRAVLPQMEKQGGGSIVNVASITGLRGCGGAVYSATKGALIAFTKHVALRYAGTPSYIRCNVVCPGSIITPMTTGMDLQQSEQAMFSQMAQHADIRNCRPCQPQEVANTVLFLASDVALPITGQAIITDFGAYL